jgi:hypothetical protein
MEGKRKKGTPWKDGPDKFEEDMKVKGTRNWHAVAKNWKKWRRILLEAKVQQTVGLEEKNRKKRNKYYLSESNLRRTQYNWQWRFQRR